MKSILGLQIGFYGIDTLFGSILIDQLIISLEILIWFNQTLICLGY